MSWTCLILALGAAVGAPGCGDAEPDVLEVVAIADARQLSIGDRAMVEGHVTVAPGTFPGATSEQELAMQDDTAGIYVVMSEALELELDAYVRVTGTLSRLGQQRVLMAEPEDVLPLEGERAIVPTRVSTGDVDASAGSLIEVSARVTRDVEVVADL
ncbi:MAG TPA: hypothetical protein VNM90_06470, partial [Haliangium sp.]|nr:hypothetical protein [Haliangium sp.]